MDANEIEREIAKRAAMDPGFAIAWALLQVCDAQQETARAIRALGNGDGPTAMGAIEGAAMHIGDRLQSLTDAILRQTHE